MVSIVLPENFTHTFTVASGNVFPEKIMAMSDKTVVMGAEPGKRDLTVCPLCNVKMVQSPAASTYICPRCGFSKVICNTFEPGTVLGGKYRVLNRLGGGGCGDLFLCHPLDNTQERYVLKILRDASSPQMFKRFLREAEILRNIREPRIVKLLDSWSDADGSYIILEYVDGKNLSQLREKYQFDEKTVLLFLREAVLALAYAWDNLSIAHRDIKPDNIMLDKKGHIRILDFGLSKSTMDEFGSQITIEQAGLGTPGFMSPEQYCNFKYADFRSDIFSLGATVCYLFTGKAPFDGRSSRIVYENTLKNSPPSYQMLADYCSGDCIELIRWMMQKEPSRRPSSYRELLETIDSIRSNLMENNP